MSAKLQKKNNIVDRFQAQLTRSTVAEEANLAEIQRLATSAAEMQAELAFRPTREDIDDLTSVVGQLRLDLLARDQHIERLQATLHRETPTADRAVETSRSLEDLRKLEEPDAIDAGKISAEIDEMFALGYDDEDEETDSAATEINRDDASADTERLEGSIVRLDDEERLQLTMQNGSLHALEEELVRAKERWAEVAADRARLAGQLALLQNKPRVLNLVHIVALVVPVLAAFLYYLLFPYLS